MFRRNGVLLVTFTLIAAILAVVTPTASPAGAAGPATCSYADTGSGYDVSWELEPTATKHVVYRTVDGSSLYWRGAVDAPGTSFNGDANPTNGGTVVYTVTAKDGNTDLGSTTCTLVAPTVPTSCEVVDTGNGFAITWDQTTNDAVIVYRSVDGSTPYWRGRVDAPGLTFADGALPSGATAVEYTIRHRVDPTNGPAITISAGLGCITAGIIGGTQANRMATPDGLTDDIIRLADEHLTGSGETVLGHFADDYIGVAQQRGASYFDIGDASDTLSVAQRWAANKRVLDAAIANGDQITLVTTRSNIRFPSALADEIQYLTANGYSWVDDVTLAPG